jgi:hypothetical protein
MYHLFSAFQSALVDPNFDPVQGKKMKRKEKMTLIIRFSGVYGVSLFNSSVTFNVFCLSFSTMKLR